MWQCRRTADYCEKLKRDGFSEMIYNKTGLVGGGYAGTDKSFAYDGNRRPHNILRGMFNPARTGIMGSTVAVIGEALVRAGITAADVASMGITNQRETTLVWDKKTGKPVYNAIVWQW